MSMFKTLGTSDHILARAHKSAGSINYENKCTLSSLDFHFSAQERKKKKKVTIKELFTEVMLTFRCGDSVPDRSKMAPPLMRYNWSVLKGSDDSEHRLVSYV